MSLEQASAQAVAPTMSSHAVLRGRWLPVARYASLVVAAVILLLFAASIPVYFERLRTECVEVACDSAPTPPPGEQALREVGITASFYAAYYTALGVVIALVYLAVASVLFWRKPSERIALLGAITLLVWGVFSTTFTMGAATEVYPQWRFPLEYAQFLGLVSITLFLFLFPDGRFVPRWSRWLALTLLLLLMPGYIWPNSPADYREWHALVAGSIVLTWMGSLIGLQIYRYRRVSDPLQRQQTKWVVFGVGASFLGFFTFVTLPYLVSPSFHEESSLLGNLMANTVGNICMLGIPVSIGIAILRHRLWDIDVVISRTLVYVALTGIVVGLYILIVGGFSTLLRVEGNLILSLFATGVIAVAFAPLRDRLQREINRLIYGERHEPYRVLSGLGERLEATLAPDAVLATIVQTVKDALKLPYVAIGLKRESGLGIEASAGQPVPTPLRLPLVYQGEQIGELLLGLRLGTDTFSPTDRRLLEDLARQASVAVHAVRLTGDLQRSRERLITAREEERRRLRHDLH
ncbi:MAG: GAF domain-containing protein, partial [Chloroflexota bacterium]|nr:GAF domain-containing protein [Chloroflexota bacterium]